MATALFCRVEVTWFAKHRHQERVALVDIQSSDFNAADIGHKFDDMMGLLHVKDSQGNGISGWMPAGPSMRYWATGG